MWLARLRHGVLQVATNSGRRYVEPSGWERLSLLWTFRNFKILPPQVLTQRQQKLIQALCARGAFSSPEHIDDDVVIGTVELIPTVPKKAPASQRQTLRTATRVIGHS